MAITGQIVCKTRTLTIEQTIEPSNQSEVNYPATSSKPIIAHLYEHLYCRSLTQLFKESNLIRYLDYDYWARTYVGGFIHLKAQLYTPQAEKLASQIATLAAPLDAHSIAVCISQINAEKQTVLDGKFSQLTEALSKLQATPWQNLNRFAVYDARSVRRNSRELWYSKASSRAFRTLKCEFTADNVPRELAFLFCVLVNVLADNIADELVERFGYFYDGHYKSEYGADNTKEAYAFRAFVQAAPALTSEAEACANRIHELLTKDQLVKKLFHFLQNTDFTADAQAPDEYAVYEASEALVGTAGWREIGTEKNIKKLLSQCTLRLKYGREEQIIELRNHN